MNFRKYKIQKIVNESSTIKSFYLHRKDNGALASFQPGQFITLRITDPSSGKEFTRNYTLSDRPNQTYYRITVKRESDGIVSNYLHSEIKENDTVEIGEPMGNFYLHQNSQAPVVLLSGGVGITPMLSMVENLVSESTNRNVSFVHSSIDKAVQPMKKRLQEISQVNNIRVNINHSNPSSDEIKNVDYNNSGVITKEFLASYLIDLPDSIYYLCGPYGFMEAMYNFLIDLGVPISNIHYEFFGEEQQLGNSTSDNSNGTEEYQIKFLMSDKNVVWTGEHNSILELAESIDIYPDNSCRMGTCSTCETKIIKGEIQYNPEPFMEAQENHAFICCSVPQSDLVIDL